MQIRIKTRTKIKTQRGSNKISSHMLNSAQIKGTTKAKDKIKYNLKTKPKQRLNKQDTNQSRKNPETKFKRVVNQR